MRSGEFQSPSLVPAELSLGWQMRQPKEGALLPAVLLLSKYLYNLCQNPPFPPPLQLGNAEKGVSIVFRGELASPRTFLTIPGSKTQRILGREKKGQRERLLLGQVPDELGVSDGEMRGTVCL